MPQRGSTVRAIAGASAVVCALSTATTGALVVGRLPKNREAFERTWTVPEGLGPHFNARSCGSCHASSDEATLVTVSDSVTDATGGHVFARFRVSASGAVEERARPAGASLRRSPMLAGIGLLERLSARQIAAAADPDDADGDGISGGVPSGRFGWKGRMPDLTIAVAAAFVNELGLSSPFFTEPGAPDRTPPELTREQVESVAAYVRSLPAPASTAPDDDRVGDRTFTQSGCAACHRPSFQANDRAGTITVNAYTDLLLHDMGPALADGLAEGHAWGREFRTAPLWGLSRSRGPFLHDGRAKTLEDAILMHGGEAMGAVRGYRRLSGAGRRALLRFLASL